MPRSKAQSPSEDSLEGHEPRTRVVKACQRCRLKKCKCDGTSPCSRCKSDDAICAYGKHKKSDKIIFREGYVQMLERQHTQLIAGLQEFYRRIHTHDSFPALEPGPHGQPFTHDILKALGVLQSDEWDNNNDGQPFDTTHHLSSPTFDLHHLSSPPDYTPLYPTPHPPSPAPQTTFSPISSTHPPFPHNTTTTTTMPKPRTKFPPHNIISTNQTLLMPPPVPNTISYHSELFTDLPFQIPNHFTAFGNDDDDDDDNDGFGHVDWMDVAVDGVFGNGQGPQLRIAT